MHTVSQMALDCRPGLGGLNQVYGLCETSKDTKAHIHGLETNKQTTISHLTINLAIMIFSTRTDSVGISIDTLYINKVPSGWSRMIISGWGERRQITCG